MKAWQYLVTVVLGAACLVLALVAISTTGDIQKMQPVLQQQQMAINNAQRVMQTGNSILQEMALSSVKNEKMHKLLSDNGINVQVQPQTPAASGTSSSSKKAVTP